MGICALEGLGDANRGELEQLVAEGEATPAVFKQIRALFQQAGAFTKALKLVDEHRQKAVRVADNWRRKLSAVWLTI